MGSWKVTTRHGSEVGRERLGSLDDALEEARRRVESVLGEGSLGRFEGFRTYGPGERVHARVEISGPGLLWRRDAGIDVMGDGSLVPYTGAIRKQRLDAGTLDPAIERLREALS